MHLPFNLPNERDFDVVGFGTNAVDHLITVPKFPDHGGKIELTAHSILPGGEVASTLFGLQRLGYRTAYAGAFGDDDAGRIGIASLEDAGIDLSFARIVPGAETQIAFILVDGETGERTIAWRRDDKLGFDAADAPVEIAARGRILHMTPHDTAACVRSAAAARDGGTIVSLDIDNVFDGVNELLELVDICIASEDLPGRLTGISDIPTALRAIHSKYGCGVVGVTLGDRGSVMLAGDALTEASSFAIPGGCVDTTGAGDAFRCGFLDGVLRGLPIDECAALGNAVASLKCRGLGARRALPTREEVQTMFKNV